MFRIGFQRSHLVSPSSGRISGWMLAALVGAALFVGCGDESEELLFSEESVGDPAPNPLNVSFKLSIEVASEDSRQVVIWVEASLPEAWTSLPDDPADPCYQRLIEIRPLSHEKSEQEPSGREQADALTDDRPQSAPQELPVKGSYLVIGEHLRFRPDEPLAKSTIYSIRFHSDAIPGIRDSRSANSTPLSQLHIVP
jgi:hypothetical protein